MLTRRTKLVRLAPGITLACGIAALAWLVQTVEERVLGHAVLEGLVLAIVLGMVARVWWTPTSHALPGITFASKNVLEVAIVLLGASVDGPALLRAGPVLVAAVALLVVVGIAAGVGIGRALGLPMEQAILVACGNAICGNSAIAALAPVIDADEEHVASAITFTAILGVLVVLSLPLLIPLLHLTLYQYGIVAGLTVYAVPQVLVATFGVSAVSGQIGTLVKLARVLMLGPVAFFFAVCYGKRNAKQTEKRKVALVPWFVVGFAVVGVARSLGWLPAAWAEPLRGTSALLTVVAMAGLGLSADIRTVGRAGRPVVLAVLASLGVLVGLSVLLIHALGL